MDRVLADGHLQPHPDHPPLGVKSIRVTIRATSDRINFQYELVGIAELALPRQVQPIRSDGLWEHTCFEAFVRNADTEGYVEFNFSPSTQWAAYSFDRYREDRQLVDVTEEPTIWSKVFENSLALNGSVRSDALPTFPSLVGLSAIIEETDGTKSYWALRHPPGAPDFHHPDCFALTLEAPNPA